jgi:hypothetical protein
MGVGRSSPLNWAWVKGGGREVDNDPLQLPIFMRPV